jgi:CMP-N-acetylneuraminic acid synthetase
VKIIGGACWGLIPARGGSKSIPLKNLVPFAGRPLLDYQVLAARASDRVERLICSTDDDRIAGHCAELAVEVHRRPAELATDDTPVLAVIEHLLGDLAEREGTVAECLALLQPTSPFLLAEQVRATVDALLADPAAASAQTVIACPHNHHALNQRLVRDGRVSFRFAEERSKAYNKQSKERHFLFGNLLVFRCQAALEQQTPFPGPSLAVEIPQFQGFDLDGPDDLRLGQALLDAGLAHLPE